MMTYNRFADMERAVVSGSTWKSSAVFGCDVLHHHHHHHRLHLEESQSSWMERDQRTVKVPPARQTSSGSNPWKTFQWELLAVGIVLVLFVPTSVMSAPARTGQGGEEDKPFWTNPCGNIPSDPSHHTPSQRPLSNILDSIMIAAWRAIGQIDFMEKYVVETFNTDFMNHHKSWMGMRYNWLPSRQEIPKDLGEKVPDEDLDSLTLDDLLINSYRYLQTFAVAIEQVHIDMIKQDSEFKDHFGRLKDHLKQILCEVHSAIMERLPVEAIKDVSRDVMDARSRNDTDLTSRNMRDWIIFRDYMNTIEYIGYACEYLKSKMVG